MNCLFAACLALSAAIGGDVVHDPGKRYAEVRLSGLHWSAHVGTDEAIGVELHTRGRFQIGAGLEHADPARLPLVESSWAYTLRFDLSLGERWGVGVKHRSSCSTVCPQLGVGWLALDDKGSENRGYNWIYARWSFK